MDNLFRSQTSRSKTLKNEARSITLADRTIGYTLIRRNRKTVGLRINRDGLTVSVPSQATLSSIERALHSKAAWVIENLDAWKEKKIIQPQWCLDSTFWLLGDPYRLLLTESEKLQLVPQDNKTDQIEKITQQIVSLTSCQIEKFVMTWYRKQAKAYMSERVALYADKLDVPLPKVRLSSARTRWGSCSSNGTVCLNWRLIQLPLSLVDYVVAHELSHLIEMNHSAAFWRVVESIYPDYRQAQAELKKIG
ncbi:SprT family zinc-dependent metalloprotease [Nitrosomonas sp. Is37]|uniref:M48 family metallopeptidase n=1 Tax=Nitrosomonas sp. Is37 TaxID=3080535 RepID=UPI00294B456C|nr:SprT family zinc-dependent metalloprotease [Nitrosomonas sp. Is37]MDV6344137.1 SprT family zinc-dependent metalloprotease [Nitrosomonas sp. Is37]